jgi:16S rRNA (cytosine967-C5)-methyltransferase
MPRRTIEERADARSIAHEVLVRVETTDAFADVLLAARLGRTRLGLADRALATRLVYGTLAWQGRIDHQLAALLHVPLLSLEAGVRAALRLGAYQLLFLDRVPAYAAVDASVDLVRRHRPSAAGMVNAVLRRTAAARATPPSLPDPVRDPFERLAVEWSHPRWLVQRWAAELGLQDLPQLLAANNVRAPTVVRTNKLATTRDVLIAELRAAGIVARAGAWAADAVVIERGAARLHSSAAWRQGHLAFQSEASQLIVPLLAPPMGGRVLDACAAPGGKATHAAALMGGTGLVLALDRRLSGLRRLVGEARRLGTPLHAAVGDARQPPCRSLFDAVLVDAPCSGLGTLGRHPEVRWRRRPEDIPRLAALQGEILAGVAPLVRPGGVLVYAVCTLTREETDDVVAQFSAAHPRFVVDPLAPGPTVTAAGLLRTLPHRHGLDGFFAARLRARG